MINYTICGQWREFAMRCYSHYNNYTISPNIREVSSTFIASYFSCRVWIKLFLNKWIQEKEREKGRGDLDKKYHESDAELNSEYWIPDRGRQNHPHWLIFQYNFFLERLCDSCDLLPQLYHKYWIKTFANWNLLSAFF